MAERAVKDVVKAEGTAESIAKVAKEVLPEIEKPLYNVGKNAAAPQVNGVAKSVQEGHIWFSGSPFKNKTAEELHQMFLNKGYEWRPKDPQLLMNGKGNYINPKNGRQYHIDPRNAGRYREPNHVDVSRSENYKGSLTKKRFSYLDD